jgi:site-specific DNA recombinase
MNDTIRAGLYGRVSSEQADEMTIQSQVAVLRQRIAQDGLVVDDELCFLDEGYSGSTLRRPALEKLRDVAHCGGIDRLYIHSPDRLARKYVYQAVLLEEFRKCEVDIVFLNDIQDQRSPEGELLLQMQGMIAEYERAKILERTRRGRRFAARQGKVSALAHAPYGYRYVTRQEGGGEARYEVMADQARVVQEMFAWVAVEGLSLGDVVRRLGERGVPSPTGKARWDRASVRGILMQPAYTGTAKYGKTRLFPRKNQRRPKCGDPAVPRRDQVAQATTLAEQEDIAVPALIGAEWFTAAAVKLEENRKRYREQKKGADFLLSGLLVCQRCGAAYCGRRQRLRTNEYVYYRCLGTDKYRHGGDALCTNKSVKGRVEEAVWLDLCALLKDPERLEREFERRLDGPSSQDVDSTSLQKSIAQLKRRIGRLIDAYENGWLDKAEFEPRIQRTKERLVREQETLAQHERDASNNEELRLLFGEFTAFAQQMTKDLEQADFETRRKLLRLLVNRIEVDQDEVRIVYKVQSRPFVHSPANRGILQDCLKFHVKAGGNALGKTRRHDASPNGQRREGFLPGFFHFGSLQVLFFLLGEPPKLGIAERFFVGIGWAVPRSLRAVAIVAVRYGVAKLTCQVLFRRRRFARIPQTFAKGTHCLSQTALDRIARRSVRAGRWRLLG